MHWVDDDLVYAHLGTAMNALTHHCQWREYSVVKKGDAEATIVWRVRCCCGWEGPTALDQYYATIEDARTAEREHIRVQMS